MNNGKNDRVSLTYVLSKVDKIDENVRKILIKMEGMESLVEEHQRRLNLLDARIYQIVIALGTAVLLGIVGFIFHMRL